MAVGDHKPHENDITWAEYLALVAEYGPDFLEEYKDSIFFVKDISYDGVIRYLTSKISTLEAKYNRLLAAYQADHPDFNPNEEEGDN